jgi:hypothetical protein
MSVHKVPAPAAVRGHQLLLPVGFMPLLPLRLLLLEPNAAVRLSGST